MNRDEIKTGLVALGWLPSDKPDEYFTKMEEELNRRKSRTILLGDFILTKESDNNYELARI